MIRLPVLVANLAHIRLGGNNRTPVAGEDAYLPLASTHLQDHNQVSFS
jgi:hypothetical protein